MSPPELGAEALAWWRALPLDPFERDLVRVLLLTVGMFVLVHGLERAHRLSAAPYRRRGFLHDLAFWFYYRLGLHQLLFLASILPLLAAWLPARGDGVLADLPFALQALLYFLVGDLCAYWIHRALHHFGWLWAFHSVHHSQTELTFASSLRFHPFDQLLQNVIMFVPFSVMGFDVAVWIPLYLASELTASLQHSRVPWSYGPLYRVVVSPEFHRYHHAADPAYHHANFSGIFSFWDYLFGTAAMRTGTAPIALGIDGVRHDSIWAALAGPFRQLRSTVPPTLAPEDSNVRG